MAKLSSKVSNNTYEHAVKDLDLDLAEWRWETIGPIEENGFIILPQNLGVQSAFMSRIRIVNPWLDAKR